MNPPGPQAPAPDAAPDATPDAARDALARRFSSPLLAELFEHWCAARGAEPMPRRDAIDPMAFKSALPYVWIYRLEADGEFRCTLAGEEVHRAWGRPITGRPARDFLGGLYDARIKPRWLYMLSSPAVLYAEQMSTPLHKPVERLVLPVADAAGAPVQVLGVSHYRYPSFGTRTAPVNPVTERVGFYHAATFAKLEAGL